MITDENVFTERRRVVQEQRKEGQLPAKGGRVLHGPGPSPTDLYTLRRRKESPLLTAKLLEPPPEKRLEFRPAETGNVISGSFAPHEKAGPSATPVSIAHDGELTEARKQKKLQSRKIISSTTAEGNKF